jgi:hypothetical protein
MKYTIFGFSQEKLANIGARVAVMIQRDIERLEERIGELEQKVGWVERVVRALTKNKIDVEGD